MTDDAPEEQQPATEQVQQTEAPETPTPPRRRRLWKWLSITVAVLVLVPGLLFTIWSWIALSFSYSSGQRAGYVQKFSEKGWICKTWEGELSMINIPGSAPERWLFTVRDDSVAKLILSEMGNRVSLTYDEKRGLPTSCFGETDYFVTGVRRVQ